MNEKVVVVMDDQDVKIESVNAEEIPAMLDSGFVSAVLKIVDGKIRYASVNWKEYKVEEWKKPELEDN